MNKQRKQELKARADRRKRVAYLLETEKPTVRYYFPKDAPPNRVDYEAAIKAAADLVNCKEGNEQ